MAFPIRYRVPYQVDIHAVDLGSGHFVNNTLYYGSNFQTVAPPAYGQPIAGNGSTLTLLQQVRGLWGGFIARLNHNYVTRSYVMRAITGKRYSTSLLNILGLASGAPVTITTLGPHGFVTGQTVAVSGVTSPVTANGFWTITVLTASSFSLNGSNIVGAWSADGFVQRVAGALEFTYADQEVLTFSDAGGVAGDALPLFATSSVRRLNGGVGRNFRSRFSLSPMSEVDAVDGGFTAAQKALMVTALANFNVSTTNGGTDATSGFSFQLVVSKALAFGLGSPFADRLGWTSPVLSMVQQPNCGSLVRRKPKLNAVIA
jgi:hypothetical protein